MRSCKSELSIIYRLLTVLILIAIPIMSQAQSDIACDGEDPYDSTCPLDTWVIVLVIVAGVFTAIHLHRKQKSLRA